MSKIVEPGYVLKLRRAQEHLNFINSEGIRFIERNSNAAIPFQPKPENEWTILRWGEVEPLSLMWGTYMGDAIHNMRCALDHFLCTLILLNDPNHSIEHAQFPIYDGEKQWINDIERRDHKVRGAAPTDGLPSPLLAAIKELQPYHLRRAAKKHSPLRLLLIASNADKHRAVHASLPRIAPTTAAKKGKLWIAPKGYFQIIKSELAYGKAIKEGAEFGRMKVRTLRVPPPGTHVHVRVKVPLEVAFSVERKSLITKHTELWAMLNEVGRIISELEKVAGIRR